MRESLDLEKAQAFARQVFGFYTGGVVSLLINIGYRTGLFAAATEPATSAGLAQRAGLDERYVREWLGAMATARIFTYDPATREYTLPAEHALCLTGSSRFNVAPGSALVPLLGRHVSAMTRIFGTGGGIPYSDFQPDFTEVMDDLWRRIYDDDLLTGFLPAAPGMTERLAAGARVADIGCGTGHAVNLMAAAYPRSTFVGYDLNAAAIDAARREAAKLGLSNARFEVADAARLSPEGTFEVVTCFDAIHDQVDPAAVLRGIRGALVPGGVFLMVDIRGTSDVAEDMDNPFAPLYYGISVMHCMTVSLAEGGVGLGTMWGEKVARRMLADAGFRGVEVVDAPRPQNVIYVCRV